jgi:hypothetical protein
MEGNGGAMDAHAESEAEMEHNPLAILAQFAE